MRNTRNLVWPRRSIAREQATAWPGRVVAAVADQGAAMVAAQEGAGAPTQKIECAVFDDARVQISDRARIESLDGGNVGVLVARAALDIAEVACGR